MEFETSMKVPEKGSFVLTGVLQAEGMKDLAFEQPFFAAGGTGTYAMAPESARIPEIVLESASYRYVPTDFNFNKKSIPTPHRVWAKPYAGGRPRVLALVANGGERHAHRRRSDQRGGGQTSGRILVRHAFGRACRGQTKGG